MFSTIFEYFAIKITHVSLFDLPTKRLLQLIFLIQPNPSN